MHATTIIVGIDCATQAEKRGFVLGRLISNGRCEIGTPKIGLSDREIAHEIRQAASKADRVLLALDAPLGWPAPFGSAVAVHMAGQTLSGEADHLFRRETDRFVKRVCGKQPLDVAADRIARTAHSALGLLSSVSQVTGRDTPLAWSPEFSGLSAIEVYPAATLRSYGLPDSRYKAKEDRAVRGAILGGLPPSLLIPEDTEPFLDSADMLDAVVCVLAGMDFLSGNVYYPIDSECARKEGWIWVRPTHARHESEGVRNE